MNTKLFTILLLLFSGVLFASEKPATLRSQLEELNKFWVGRLNEHAELNVQATAYTEVELIQSHLSLVERQLRQTNTSHLDAQQQANRLLCLDILHDYWLKGVFPQNIYHRERTPYFIDHLGTACAVGQLIISTGFENLALQINKENNYGYIYDLAKDYPAISKWADEFGFELAELAWIQPCYCSYVKVETRNVSCYGGNDGYFKPDMSAVKNPTDLKLYVWLDNEWKMGGSMCGPCQLAAGKYKITVLDENKSLHAFEATITQPDPISIELSVSGDASSCNASAICDVQNASGSLAYHWTEGSNLISTTNIASDLCNKKYSLVVVEMNKCFHNKVLDLVTFTSIAERSIQKLEIYPNPVKNSLSFRLSSGSTSGPVTVSFYNALGERCYQHKFEKEEAVIDISELKSGLYVLKAETAAGTVSNKFIKE